jgi:hypothetical protein
VSAVESAGGRDERICPDVAMTAAK